MSRDAGTRYRRHRQAGFTLLELLVALVLVGLLAMMMTGGMRFGSRVWESSQRQAEATAETHAIRRFVRARALAARAVRPPRDDQSEAEAGFAGSADALRLVTLMPAYVAQGGLYALEIGAARGDDGQRLDLAWWPHGGAKAGPGSGSRVLLDRIERVEMSYFGDPDNAGNESWRDSWPDDAAMPRLISIKVAFPEDDQRLWPELIVPLVAAGNPPRRRGRR